VGTSGNVNAVEREPCTYQKRKSWEENHFAVWGARWYNLASSFQRFDPTCM